MNEIEYIAYSNYEVVALSSIYSEHIKNIEKGIISNYLIQSDLKIEVLNALKICYLDNGTENLFESKEYNKGRRFLIANICKFIDEKVEELNDAKNVFSKKIHQLLKPTTLFDIWIPKPDDKGNKEQYIEHVNFLMQENKKIDTSFVTEINGKLYWTKIKGWQQYMAGFIYTCIKKKWIAPQHSAPKFVEMLNNTFNVKPNVKPFKSILTTPPKDIYLEPFKSLPTNTISK